MLWNLIIKSHVDSGAFDKALLLYREMRELGVVHDGFTFPIINRAILLLQSDLLYGEIVHSVAVKIGYGSDVYFCNTMIEVYGRCGHVSYARKLFDEMRERDLISWTSMISGYVDEGSVDVAFRFFNKMMLEIQPNSVTVIVLLQGCSIPESFNGGRLLHEYVVKSGLLIDYSVQNSILRLYTKVGSVEEVEACFGELDRKDIVSWNILISFYSSRRDTEDVANRFNEMQCEVAPSIETLTLVISAFAKSSNLIQGSKLHCFAIKLGLYDNFLKTSLLDFYAKCGELGKSARLFGEIPHESNITWRAMISGLVHNGHVSEAIELFGQMKLEDHEPTAVILRSLVDGYTHLGALQSGKAIHGYIIRNLLDGSDEKDILHLKTSILNMYVRCGSISSARMCFNRMLVKDMVIWTSMIEGYGSHGLGFEALELFHQMVEKKMEPNSVTFLNLLSACSHSGLVREGLKVFHFMKWKFGIEPDLDHYTCIVDLLGRFGKLKVALTIIMKMIILPDSRIWGALFSASRVYGDKKLAEYASQRLLLLEPDNVGYYTMLSNVHASVGQWIDSEEVRRAMIEKDLKKKPGWSFIEEKGMMHGFVSGDRSHNQIKEIHEVLGCLSRKIST